MTCKGRYCCLYALQAQQHLRFWGRRTEGPRAEKTREFAALLEEATGLRPILWDERRSSIEAHSILHANGRKMKDHRKNVDAVAATLMLEAYLGRGF